jgi:hydrogenase maturation protein HypF
MTSTALPRPAPARVLAVGAWLKNRACLLDGDRVHWSPLHGDLGTAEACRALQASARALLDAAGGRVDALAHDLHPDFASTRLALALAAELGVPALPVQHHHAHIAVLQAEAGRIDPVIGLALDGVGLGSDGTAWGGELLRVAGADCQRLGHLAPLALPGGDAAAREPWRMAAALLHALGRGDQIVPRLAPAVGPRLASGVQALLARGLHCPPTTSAGRWFDAVAGLLGLSVRQAAEAEAAVALEQAATRWLQTHPAPAVPTSDLGLRALSLALCEVHDAGEGAALFHRGLAQALADAAIAAARTQGIDQVALGGGCFLNRLLTQQLVSRLQAAGLAVQQPRTVGCGDAGLALGQAWAAAQALAGAQPARPHRQESPTCA